eukprot:UN02958
MQKLCKLQIRHRYQRSLKNKFENYRRRNVLMMLHQIFNILADTNLFARETKIITLTTNFNQTSKFSAKYCLKKHNFTENSFVPLEKTSQDMTCIFCLQKESKKKVQPKNWLPDAFNS